MHGSETWPMKVDHELKMNRTEMSMFRWMCGVKLNESMGGATGGCVWGVNAPPPTFGTSGVQGGTEGRSSENDFCFYSRQSLFSTVQVTEFQLP